MIDSGIVKNQAELARKLGISRARITQILNLLNFDKELIEKVEQLGEPDNNIGRTSFSEVLSIFLLTDFN